MSSRANLDYNLLLYLRVVETRELRVVENRNSFTSSRRRANVEYILMFDEFTSIQIIARRLVSKRFIDPRII